AAPEDQSLKFALGVSQTLRALENLSARWYAMGLLENGFTEQLPLLRLPVPPIDQPIEVDSAAIDAALEAFARDLGVAIRTLSEVRDPNVKLVVPILRIQVDLNGEAPDGEMMLAELLARIGLFPSREEVSPEAIDAMTFAFDLGDVRWLEGYCHLTSAFAEMARAYDKTPLIEYCGHLMFQRVKTPFAFLTARNPDMEFIEGTNILDLVAMIHQFRLQLQNAARQHLLDVTRLSRASWSAIRAETDNDREWIPGPGQTTPLMEVEITPEIIDAWLAMMNDLESLLEGRKLAPFWRGDNVRMGVNFRRVFTEPREFDLILWIQGTAAAPYLEEGELLDDTNFNRLQRLLNGNALLFAIWVN
ncbi:MAG TPA: hypothetical protein PKB10_07675, partial [Tepidisphaeraceae bacterium]|nr:hypothetical protein [Tepidisphaeraceae bacterium]